MGPTSALHSGATDNAAPAFSVSQALAMLSSSLVIQIQGQVRPYVAHKARASLVLVNFGEN